MGVALGVEVGVGVSAGVGVGVADGVAVGVKHGTGTHETRLTVSARHPSPEPLLSLAIRQRSLQFVKMVSFPRSTTVVMNPCELPLQA